MSACLPKLAQIAAARRLRQKSERRIPHDRSTLGRLLGVSLLVEHVCEPSVNQFVAREEDVSERESLQRYQCVFLELFGCMPTL